MGDVKAKEGGKETGGRRREPLCSRARRGYRTYIRSEGEPKGERKAPQAVLPFLEGEAPRALLVEGATRAPLIERRSVIHVKDLACHSF